MSLVLEVEYLSGICFAAIGPDSDVPDWPPQPDRVFSALVATWGTHGEKEEEAQVLKWLETQPPPKIQASDHFPRMAPVSFVPPNDSATGRQGNITVMPFFRRRQPRRFAATWPDTPVVRFFWPGAAPDNEILALLNALAADTAYIGHSASLTRCHFRRVDDAAVPKEVRSPKQRIYPGRFVELRNSYEIFIKSNGKKGRPLPGAQVKPEPQASETLPHVFSDRWLLLEHVNGEMPDIRGSAIVTKAIRHTLLCGYKRIGLENHVPEVVSGHAFDGSPSRIPHLAIVPLAFTGFAHADGHTMGFALVPPRDSGIFDEADFRSALREVAPLNENLGRRFLIVKSKAGALPECAFSIGLSPTFEPPVGKRSLDSALYTKPARTFATVTPIALDRHLKEKGDARREEIVAQIVTACRNVGLPEPETVAPDKHSAIEGAPSAWLSGKAPAWMHWRLPATLKNRQLTHAVIRFVNPVQGPVILGAGRFVGLGFFRPLLNLDDKA